MTRHRQKCTLRFLLGGLHVSLTSASRLSMKGSHRQTFFQMGRRSKRFEKPCSKQLQGVVAEWAIW